MYSSSLTLERSLSPSAGEVGAKAESADCTATDLGPTCSGPVLAKETCRIGIAAAAVVGSSSASSASAEVRRRRRLLRLGDRLFCLLFFFSFFLFFWSLVRPLFSEGRRSAFSVSSSGVIMLAGADDGAGSAVGLNVGRPGSAPRPLDPSNFDTRT